MRLHRTDHSLVLSDIPALNARTAPTLVAQAAAALPPHATCIEIDLAQTDVVDSHGLGTLIGFYRSLHHRGRPVAFRLLNPSPPAQQLIELTRLQHLFEVVHDSPAAP
jgi:anti-anti-sigma factor